MAKKHLAIFSQPIIKQIFKGKKTVETRFSKKRIAPFGAVSIGDIVYIKPPGEEVVGQFSVKKVIFFDGLDKNDWQFIKKQFGKQAFLPDGHQDARFATIILMDNIEQFITNPLKVEKKDLRGWMVLD